MASTFDYLIDKVNAASFVCEPFPHLEITEFLSAQHFQEIVRDSQINLDGASGTEELLERIEGAGYEIISFPGCVTSKGEYLKWYNGKKSKSLHEATEGFGVVYRLTEIRGGLLRELDRFCQSELWKTALIEKFKLEKPVTLDAGVQKYLHGYEISPHPDIRRKALTWMLNINPGVDTERHDYHTHYLKLRPEWAFVSDYWRDHQNVDRDWLPWDWCETVKRQTRNNSIVIFSPSDDSIHAVKASYDHLKSQRTQLYGNLWYKERAIPKMNFQNFDPSRKTPVLQALKSSAVGQALRGVKKRFDPNRRLRRGAL